jgi:hypothetical protein
MADARPALPVHARFSACAGSPADRTSRFFGRACRCGRGADDVVAAAGGRGRSQARPSPPRSRRSVRCATKSRGVKVAAGRLPGTEGGLVPSQRRPLIRSQPASDRSACRADGAHRAGARRRKAKHRPWLGPITLGTGASTWATTSAPNWSACVEPSPGCTGSSTKRAIPSGRVDGGNGT